MSQLPNYYQYGSMVSQLLPNPYGKNTVNAINSANSVNSVNAINQSAMMNIGRGIVSLCLNQIDGFQPVREFTDSNNIVWTLVKDSGNSTVEIPDPKGVQIIDYWNHPFPGIQQKLYVYVVEGIKAPRVETEKPTRVMYQWFSTLFIQQFTPQMITEREWRKANVYAAPMTDSRVSKLKAICHINEGNETPSEAAQQADPPLIQVEEFSNGNSNGTGNIE